MEGMEAAFSVTGLPMLTILGTPFLESGDQGSQNKDQKATWRTESQSKKAIDLSDAKPRPE